jgi:thiamine pyrophosphate-dependent acetolactate synthase large subunit-like protein
MNVATTDAHDLTGDEANEIAAADLVLAFEVSDLAGMLAAGGRRERNNAPLIVDVGLDRNLVGSWVADYQRLVPVAQTLPADAALAADALTSACASSVGRIPDAVAARNERIALRHAELRAAWRAAAESASSRRPIATEWVAHEVGRVLGDRDVVLANGTLNGWARKLWDLERAGAYLGGNGGGGIGYGIGATVGAAIAHRNTGRTVVNLQPDGDLLYAPSALWTLTNQALPVLTVVWNNGGYRNSEEHSERVAEHRGRSFADARIGNRIEDPHVDFVSLARAYGMWAEGPVDGPYELGPVLERALAEVDAGGPALVEVRAAAR